MDFASSFLRLRPLSDERRRRVGRLHTRKQRERAGEVLIEGPRAISAALRAGARIAFVVIEEGQRPHVPGIERLSDVDTCTAPPEVFRSLALTQQPQGILAVAEQPRATLAAVPHPSTWGGVPLLVLDALQDPGNLGTLFRSAAAMRCPAVVLLDGTVDPWSPKVVRASAGELFGISVVQAGWHEVASWLESAGVPLWVASASGEDVRDLTHGTDAPVALVLGNEGRGPRAEVLARAVCRVAIPLEGGVESLNAAQAGTLLLWALGPGRRWGPEPGTRSGVGPAGMAGDGSGVL
jgi:RNA methyltransferase, TrmH family